MIREFQINDIDQVMSIWLASNLDSHSFVHGDYWTSNAVFVREQLLKAEIYVFEEQNNQVIVTDILYDDYRNSKEYKKAQVRMYDMNN